MVPSPLPPFDIFFLPVASSLRSVPCSRGEADAPFPRVNVGEWGNSERRSEQSSDKGNHGMEGGKTVHETRLSWL